MSRKKAFEQWSKKQSETGFYVEHEKDCTVAKLLSNTPINECPCDCHDKYIFNAGYNAAKGRAK